MFTLECKTRLSSSTIPLLQECLDNSMRDYTVLGHEYAMVVCQGNETVVVVKLTHFSRK